MYTRSRFSANKYKKYVSRYLKHTVWKIAFSGISICFFSGKNLFLICSRFEMERFSFLTQYKLYSGR